MIKSNFHTHTFYCDGKDTPEEMVKAAIESGLDILGFSGHSPLGDADWCMSEEELTDYKAEILNLKEKYREKIEILCGLEHDYYSENSTDGFDYIIGSVHALRVSDGLLPLDDSREILENGINKYFGGDALALAECYFETLSDVVRKTSAQIIGHTDLITKYDEKGAPLFDTTHPRYTAAYTKAVKKLCESGALFEVNTGAMTRGLRTTPYPHKDILKVIRECGADVIINSDCHDRNFLTYGFEDALALLKECGFHRVAYLSKGTVKFQKI